MRKEDLQTIVFAALVCLVCSLLLASTHASLKGRQELNRRIDKQINILKAFRPAVTPGGEALSEDEQARYFDAGKVPREMITQYFETFVNTRYLDENGQELEDFDPDAVDPRVLSNPKQAPNVLYVWKDDQGQAKKFAFPSQGKGLWSTIHSYVGLKDDLATIQGITFFDHGETPGLGGEASKPWFQANFRGKKLFKDGEPTDFTVLKGKEADIYPNGNDHAVDGMSGATITGKGIETFLNEDFRTYNQYFAKIRKQD